MSTNNKVQLANYEIELLAMISDPKERARIQAERLAARQDRADKSSEKWTAFKNSVSTLDPKVLDTGCLLIQTGTRNAIFTPEMARSVFLKNHKEILSIVNSLPETADFSKLPKKSAKKSK